ncbi:MAG: radical SAM protein [Patescibacteria group bacterium]|nr:B12-binding domain-containing radical SAM protein [Patescibacteria group bacterium]
MKILLINPPGKTSFIAPPLGLMSLATSLRNSGHFPKILDYLIENFNQDSLFNDIQKVDLIGITSVSPHINNALNLARLIKKKFPDKIIVLGGAHASLLPQETIENNPFIDFLIRGEGEIRIIQLIEYIQGQIKLKELDGIVFKKDGKIINLQPKKFIQNLDNLPMPAYDLIPFKKYSLYLQSQFQPAITMLTSRGCPFNCIYCSKPVFGSSIRTRSPKSILEEIIFLKKNYNIKEIIFYDDSFTLKKEKITKFCQLIIENNIKINWKCETRVNLVDQELLNLMKKAGCYMICYGIESGNQKILDILKKGITLEQIEKAIIITKKAKIKILGYFMIGIPQETEKNIKETINFAKKLNPDYAQFSIATAYPGTELYQIAEKQGKITKDFSDSFYALTRQKKIISLCDIKSKVLQKYLKKAYYSFYFRPSYIIQRIYKIKSFNDLIYNLKGLKALLRI